MKSLVRLGIHIRTGVKGLEGSARDAGGLGCEAIQIFAANPNAWESKEIRPEIAAGFRAVVANLGSIRSLFILHIC